MSVLTTAARMWLTRSFRSFVFTGEYDQNLSYADAQSLGLYVHIPFCRSLCDFCPYCKTVYDEETAQHYLKALLKEIELVGSGNPVRRVSSLYFGGGSPALFADHIKIIIDTLKRYFILTDGVGVELHPEDVRVETLEKLKAAGVTRISIGVQSFQNEALQLLGRSIPEDNRLANSLRAVPFETVSMDFIFALPGQTFEWVKSDIDRAFEIGANHIAIYPFIDFTFTGSKVEKMNDSAKHRLLDEITDYCLSRGYIRDSIWTFAKIGTPKYSSMTRDNFLGFGCSATTLLKDQFKINTLSVEAYIDRIQQEKLPTSLTIRFTPRQRMVYYLFWRAYTTQISEADFYNFFGVSLKQKFSFEFWAAQAAGYMVKEQNGYRLTKKGAFYFHYYENFYTLAYIDKMWGLMRQKPFPEKLVL